MLSSPRPTPRQLTSDCSGELSYRHQQEGIATMTVGTQAATIRRREKRRLLGRDGRVAYVFLAPWLIGLVGITLGPLVASLFLSFTHYDLFNNPTWIGLGNYHQMLVDPAFLQSLEEGRVDEHLVIVAEPYPD